jgi:hypothetical protein
MTKVRDGFPRRAKAADLDRRKAELEHIVQPRQLGLVLLLSFRWQRAIPEPSRQSSGSSPAPTPASRSNRSRREPTLGSIAAADADLVAFGRGNQVVVTARGAGP